jgi:hypothetical protein
MSFQQFFQLELTWMGIGLITFIYLLFQNAPYGRHTTKGWGPVIDNHLGWIIMEGVVLVVLIWHLLYFKAPISLITGIMIALFVLHYIHRSFIFPFMIRTKGKKMPLIIAMSAIIFNLVNGSQIGYYFSHYAHYTKDWLSDPRFIFGSLLFISGAYINVRSDYYLIGLRKSGDSTTYKIPKGFLFDYISCPNHFGEIIEWAGFAILTWSLPGLVFFCWTCANLIPRALAHHRWYLEKFAEYPVDKKAVFPFIW